TMQQIGLATVLKDQNGNAFLSVQPTNPAQWAASLAVSASAQAGSQFQLQTLYYPSGGGVGVTVPVTLETFTSLTLANAESVVNSSSLLIVILDSAQGLDVSQSAYELMNFDPSDAVPVIFLTG